MKIAVIGSGNVGGTLAKAFIKAGHTVVMGVRFPLSDKSVKLATEIGKERFDTVEGAVGQAEAIVVSAPATKAIEVAKELGNTEGKVIIDTMNIVMGQGPQGYSNTAEAILAHTPTKDVVKCFNTTGFENMANPDYNGQAIDMFVAGGSEKAKAVAIQLAKDIGFGAVYDFGGNDKFFLIEQFALCWINLAIFQKRGRGMAFHVLNRPS
jgi:hypothetical protein